MEFKYGRRRLRVDLEEERIIATLTASEREGLKAPLAAVRNSLTAPAGTPPLGKMLEQKQPHKVVIIVNDVSRPTPYDILLPPVLEVMAGAGIKKEQITFIIATGVHEPHTREQSEEIFGKDITADYRFIFHDCDSDLVDYGKLSSGNRLYVNREAAEADFILATGVILPHYFAGFSGGRKSILPGVSGRSTIENNHSWMVKIMDKLPPVEKNPVNLEMIEAAKLIGLDFILNVVTNSKREVVQVVAGDVEEAWLRGVKTSEEMYHVPLAEKGDVAVVSAGGYPRDINVYQAQKALDHADKATRKGGTIILLASCAEGLGEEVFTRWMLEAEKPADNIRRIKEKFVIGGHKAYAICKVARDKEVILISDLDRETTELLFAEKMDTPAAALNYVREKYGDNYRVVLMPQGSLTVPVSPQEQQTS